MNAVNEWPFSRRLDQQCVRSVGHTVVGLSQLALDGERGENDHVACDSEHRQEAAADRQQYRQPHREEQLQKAIQ